jgi:hypothetical protein
MAWSSYRVIIGGLCSLIGDHQQFLVFSLRSDISSYTCPFDTSHWGLTWQTLSRIGMLCLKQRSDRGLPCIIRRSGTVRCWLYSNARLRKWITWLLCQTRQGRRGRPRMGFLRRLGAGFVRRCPRAVTTRSCGSMRYSFWASP